MEKLLNAGLVIANRAANEYLAGHGLKADEKALVACLTSWVQTKFPEAMKDARTALDCGMKQVAEQTFAASMALAGVEAAKESGFPA